MKKFYNADANEASGAGPGNQKEPELSGSKVSEGGDIKKEEDQDNLNSAGIDEEIVQMRYGLEAQDKIRDFRIRIDSLYLTAKQLVPSRYSSLAVTCFQNARQFCGIILGELGAESPYIKRIDNTTTERSDKGSVIVFNIHDAVNSEISVLKIFREKAEEVIIDFSIYIENTNHSSIKQFISQNAVMQQLMSGKMWLGERIGEIAEQQAENTKGE